MAGGSDGKTSDLDIKTFNKTSVVKEERVATGKRLTLFRKFFACLPVGRYFVVV